MAIERRDSRASSDGCPAAAARWFRRATVEMNQAASTKRLFLDIVMLSCAGLLVVTTTLAQTNAPSGTNSAAVDSSKPAAKPSITPRYHPDRFAGRAGKYYSMVWGVDSLAVRWAESGELIRVSYRVLDPDKAKALNDGRSEPSLIAPRAGVSLVVPSMEKIGKLRQSMRPEEGKTYWMAFSNKGRLVKRGDRVTLLIGNFRADGLVVD